MNLISSIIFLEIFYKSFNEAIKPYKSYAYRLIIDDNSGKFLYTEFKASFNS